jgi:5-(carboxyamino)imidazole ribonucleotide mutase
MKAILILGSETDAEWAKQITDRLTALGVGWEQHVASAHKTPRKVLDILERNAGERCLVYVTIAGRSNALSGFVAGNTTVPVLACPPFTDKVDMLVNVHSTLQMPSSVPVLTVLDPGNCADAVKRILDLAAR